MSAVFDHYAAYYDLLYRDKDYAGEAAYVADLLREGRPGTASLLELGCGTGAHAEHLAHLGFRVQGVDASERMLAAATQRRSELPPEIAKCLTFSTGDVRHLQTGSTHDAVISLFHVMSYQTTNADLLDAFRTAARHLANGGRFLFDVWYGPAVLTLRPEVRVKRLENDHYRVTRIAEPGWRPRENIIDVNYQVWVETLATGQINQLRETHTMRYFFEPELDLMLRDAGFRLAAIHGWLDHAPPSADTWSAVIVAERL